MIYLAAVIFIFTLMQLVVTTANLLFKPNLRNYPLKNDLLISVLIPARNEAKNIGVILDDLHNLQNSNIEIIVFDDQSEDDTGKIVLSMAKTDSRISLMTSKGLPSGWLGKNFACHSLSNYAKGEYLLFLDADVRIQNDIIPKTVAYAERFHLGLLSIFPKQIILTSGERMTVPIMNYILLSLLPLSLVQWSRFGSLAAANGQFMLFNAKIYKTLLPHKLMKKNKVEDIAIAHFYKQENIPIACLTGDESIRCRMYGSYWEAVNGFSKNITAFFGNSYLMALIFWMITTFGFFPVIIFLPVNFLVVYIVMYLMIRLFVSRASHQHLLWDLVYLVPQQLTCGVILIQSFRNKLFYNYQWKGRNIG